MSRTQSRTATFTAARVRQVMNSVYDDLLALVSARLLSREDGARWYEDLLYLLLEAVVETFEVQIEPPGASPRALRYVVRDDGRIQGSMPSGGLDLYFLPIGTSVTLYVTYRADAGDLTRIHEELARRGWTAGGAPVGGRTVHDRSYGAGGWGVERSRVGEWDE